jgi:Fe-S-cluster-containing dehydrogenase component/DMSO reductase anchor subunit
MKRGFVFEQSLCVNCKACSAACSLENSFTVKVRNVLTYNHELSVSVPLTNLSIACNHCEIPVCLTGCPASAYRFDPLSDAVILDETKCIGCKYCIWNCPFDAPKYDPHKRVIGKCHFCYSRMEEGFEPACTSGCPTGALSFTEVVEFNQQEAPDWFPGYELSPALSFIGSSNTIPLRIVPTSLFRNEMKQEPVEKKYGISEWSLILFSFFSLISVSLMSASLINSDLQNKILLITLTILPGVFSLFHLGKWNRAWRAVTNLKNSPLSREIVIYIIYLIFTLAATEFMSPWLIISASVAGLVLLLAIDSVYIFTMRNMAAYFHSGQTFISSLLIISFLSNAIVPFIFIAILKTGLIVYSYRYDQRNMAILRHVRMAMLMIAAASIISGISYPEITVIILLLTGELFDRILFYFDFEPTKINNLIYKHIAEGKNETKGD